MHCKIKKGNTMKRLIAILIFLACCGFFAWLWVTNFNLILHPPYDAMFFTIKGLIERLMWVFGIIGYGIVWGASFEYAFSK